MHFRSRRRGQTFDTGADARPRGGTRSCALPIPGPRGSAALRGNRMNIHISFTHNQQPPRLGRRIDARAHFRAPCGPPALVPCSGGSRHRPIRGENCMTGFSEPAGRRYRHRRRGNRKTARFGNHDDAALSAVVCSRRTFGRPDRMRPRLSMPRRSLVRRCRSHS
jgi:hypothetical protein